MIAPCDCIRTFTTLRDDALQKVDTGVTTAVDCVKVETLPPFVSRVLDGPEAQP